jgi:predicted nucleic-acid-binding protein
MKAVDTNILVRFFTQDDSAQSPQAEAFLLSFSASDPVWVGLPVVLELVWVLDVTYRMSRNEIAHILHQLLTRQAIAVERANAVREALYLYRSGRADFADCMISTCARAAGCNEILTFDGKAARDARMQLLE